MTDLTGVLLAGGRAERMGGHDKGLLPLAGEPLITHSLRRLQPQVAELLISANRHLELYQRFGCQVVSDSDRDFRGPLAGILAALRVARTPYVLIAPCDSPLLPPDYAQRMVAALEREQATVSVRYRDEYWQPVFALVPVRLQDDLADYLATGAGNAGRWLQRHCPAPVEFPDESLRFRNINTPDDLAQLEADWPRLKDKS
ncbi:molybdenum cofactor guanylyltransferase MobA [Candidatus Contendibacter odensensis]|uniref:molybdenum cofactor guanylyltransferase MobA n=1 Tax=Candidatus Contendibacter odensensis TaxID=1400860 RepID=UPI0004B43D67|nr:molybdenum cofactor guanylyltransferase MobA [Candidatus Contendobacter odensis]